tara:strand:+ start:1054 stop:1302 length:249 start_codon:yes stop_codon:yes gene_type:complete
MKDLVASIQDRLKNLSRSEGIALNLILEDYANARLFARLSASRYRKDFILKGAQLFKLWSDTPTARLAMPTSSALVHPIPKC